MYVLVCVGKVNDSELENVILVMGGASYDGRFEIEVDLHSVHLRYK